MLVAAFFFRYRVIAVSSPGMAAADPFQTHPTPFDHTPFFDAVNHVLRAGRGVSAGIRQVGGNTVLIEPNQPDQQK